jgi:hypothetical protein
MRLEDTEAQLFLSVFAGIAVACVFLWLANRALRSRTRLRQILKKNEILIPAAEFAQARQDTNDMFGALEVLRWLSIVELTLFVLLFALLIWGFSMLAGRSPIIGLEPFGN